MIKKEQGYTLIELLVTIAITGIIFTVIGTAIYQLSTVSGYGNDKLTADHELQNAAYWFNLDGQTAVTSTGGDILSFSLPSGNIITYSLEGTVLERSVGPVTTTLAQNISSANFSVEGRLVSMDITSSPSGRANVNVQQVYKVYLRPVQ